MPYDVPSDQQLVTDLTRAAGLDMPGSDAALRRNNLKPTVKIMAGGLSGLYGYAQWIFRQIFVSSADGENLDRHGAQMKPAVPRKLASAASGLVTVTASAASGLSAGDVLTRMDGVSYSVDVGGALPMGVPVDMAVTALSSGAAGNAAPLVQMTSANGLVASAVVASGGVSGGADIEQDEPYRRRLIFSNTFPEHAGAAPDYVRYATSVPGCTRCFVARGVLGRSTVTLYPMFDLTNVNGIPTPVDLARVAARVALNQPGAARVFVAAPSVTPINVTISDLSPGTPAVKRAVQDELIAMVRRNARVAGNLSPHPSMPFLATPVSLQPSWIWEAVSLASGEQSHTVVSPTLPVVVPPGSLPVLNSVTFV